MSRTPYNGECKICAKVGPLTFEHTPPKSAFNNRSVIVSSFHDVVAHGLDTPLRGKQSQKGMGRYSICAKCNNDTGGWYAPAFVDLYVEGVKVVNQAKGKQSVSIQCQLSPLRIIKQIVVMFFTVNQLGFHKSNPELVKFVLNKEERFLSKKYRVFIYFNIEGGFRSTGIVGMGNAFPGKAKFFSEVNYRPFGFVLTYDGAAVDDRHLDISDFATYALDGTKVVRMELAVLWKMQCLRRLLLALLQRPLLLQIFCKHHPNA